jgi:DNA recombination protein RmuC
LTISLEDGSKVRPDVVVLLPRDRFVIIDAKVSLTAFARYSRSLENGEPDIQALKDHLSSLRTHIAQLSKKKYQRVHGTQSLEVVLLFLPTDQALSLALLHDEEILSYALEHHIVPVTPATLLLALQLVHHMWDQQETDERATAILAKSREISLRTQDLWEQFSLLLQKIDGVSTLGSKVERMFTSSRTGLLPLVHHLEEPPDGSTPGSRPNQ